MNRSCLNHLLTETEREQFSKNGYLIIENALTPETLDICLAAVDRIDLQIRKELNYESVKRTNVHACIGKETSLLQMIDLFSTFPKVWEVGGLEYLPVSHSGRGWCTNEQFLFVPEASQLAAESKSQ